MRKTQSLDKVTYPAPDVVTKAIPAPTEGWDQISPLADMSPQRAPIMDNFVPRPGFIEIRKGFRAWVTSTLNSPIETLMVYEQPTTVAMYAMTASGTMLNVTSSATTATVVTSVYTSGRWEWLNYTPAGAATVMQYVNGIDSLQQISGTVITSVSITGMSVISSLAATTDFTNIAAVKRRIWYVRKNSTQAVFMPTDAIQGPIAGYLDLGALWKKGGHLVAIGNWTIDGGGGPDDYTVFISSRGQLSVYQGVDPTTTTFVLKGTFDVAPPLGKRCFYRFGSDLLIITQQGVLPISQVLPFDPSADRSTAITLRIQNTMIQSAATYGANFGWELVSYPSESLLFLNVPVTNGATYAAEQYVQNTILGSWCRFTGWKAKTFAIFNDYLYFGDSNGNIQWAYQSGNDGGANISGDLQCAFNWYDNPGRLKRMTFIQPLLTVVGAPPLIPSLGVNVDFSDDGVTGPVQTATSNSLWDVALWDVGVWGGHYQISPWVSVSGLGKALAVRLQMTYNASSGTDLPSLQINAFNTIVELGGLI